jgi:hypothetical protein
MPTWRLVDADPIAAENPYMFYKPSRNLIARIRPGEFVKLEWSMRASLLIVLLVLAGCGTLRFAPGEVQSTAKHVVPTPAIVARPTVATLFDAVGSIPLVGLFKFGRDAEVRKRLGEALDAEGLDVRAQVHSQLQGELRALELEVGSHVTERREPGAFTLFADSNELPRGEPAQMFLDTKVLYGFIATATGTDYRPYVVVNLQVLAADTHKVKYQKSFGINFPPLGIDSRVEVPAGMPSWKNVAAIEADIPGASTAFKSLASGISKAIAKQLQTELPVIQDREVAGTM